VLNGNFNPFVSAGAPTLVVDVSHSEDHALKVAGDHLDFFNGRTQVDPEHDAEYGLSLKRREWGLMRCL
jgi:hypothetical protein